MDEGGINIYQAWPLKTSFVILHISFSLRELSPTKMIDHLKSTYIKRPQSSLSSENSVLHDTYQEYWVPLR